MANLQHKDEGTDAERTADCQSTPSEPASDSRSPRSPIAVIIEDDHSVLRLLTDVLQHKYSSLTLINDLSTLSANWLNEVDCVYLGLPVAGRDWQAAVSLLARLGFKGEIRLVSHVSLSEVTFCEAVLKQVGLNPATDHIYLRKNRTQRYISSVRRSLKFVRQLSDSQPLSILHPVYQISPDFTGQSRLDF